MSNYSKLLQPVWGLNHEEVKPLIAGVENGDRSQIETSVKTLEEMLATVSQPDYDKQLAVEAEIRAKIAVLKAILSGQPSDWEAAHDSYQELKGALDSLARGCCECEDIARIMFECEAEQAAKLAALCLAQVESKKAEAAKQLLAEEARRLIDRVGPSFGCDWTAPAMFPETRADICVVRRVAEDGHSYGYDVIYLVWRAKDEFLQHRELIDSRGFKDYIHLEEVREEEGDIVVKVHSGGTYSGSPWDRSIRVPLAELDLSR